VLTIDLANTIFVVCLLAGGVLLLVTILLDDIVGGLLDSFGMDFDVGGVSLMPLLLGFVAMFGVGGLFGTEVFDLGAGPASAVGAAAGTAGAGLVYALFGLLRRAEAPEAFSLRDLIGENGRVVVGIPAGRHGTVLVSYAGSTQSLTATADTDVPAGSLVTVTDVAGSTVIVALRQPSAGAPSRA
jgi:membrane protein implicated in regulation of membrane protease activity